MSFLYYFLIFSFPFLTYGNEQTWECGNDEFSKLLSESSVEANCPELKWEVNGCCMRHDSCYDDQLGQKYCDDTFCDCLSRVTIPSKKCHEDDAESFCVLVREFGEGAYNASAPHLHTEPPKITTNLTTNFTTIPTTITPTTILPTTNQILFTKHMSSGNFSSKIVKNQTAHGNLTLRSRRFLQKQIILP